MSKFKVGDKVRIKDFKDHDIPDGWVDEMLKYRGCIMEVVEDVGSKEQPLYCKSNEGCEEDWWFEYNEVEKIEDETPDETLTKNYAKLRDVLDRAYVQASVGKGHERHATGQPYEEQPILLIQHLVGTGFATGQALKKIQESQRLSREAGIKELLGAINYIAAAVIKLEMDNG